MIGRCSTAWSGATSRSEAAKPKPQAVLGTRASLESPRSYAAELRSPAQTSGALVAGNADSPAWATSPAARARGDPEESLDWSFSLGQTTAEGGRFRLLRHHARGGIGVVFVALDSELHREVALKQIQPQHADDPTSRARFLIEAEVTGRLEHPGVVPVYGLGTNEQGQPFYAMRFVRGQSLKEAVESFHQADHQPGRDPAERTLALRQLLGRFIDVCHAIAYAHSRGVLHRDLKPANILLGPYGETLVVDWGLAKVVGRDDPTPAAGRGDDTAPCVAFGQQRDDGRHGDRHADVHEPRAGRGPARSDRPGQ